MDIFDIVDENDNVISSARRDYIHQNRLLHRSAHVLIFNGDEILLQKRSSLKDTNPNRYTTACSGHIDTGETYDEGVLRELKEETGLSLGIDDLTKIGKINACSQTGNEFTYVYTYICDKNFKFEFDKDEVDSFVWSKIDDFVELSKQEPKLFTKAFLYVYEFYLKNTK